MKSLVFVSSLLVAAGAATAAPFQALSYEAGGGLPGIVGPGITVSAGGFFTSAAAGGTNTAGGSAAGFTLANEGEFDSHFSLDGFGPSARNRSLAASLADNSVCTTSFYGDYGAVGAVAASYNELEGGLQNGFGPFNGAGSSFVTGPGSHVGDPAGDASNPENQARAGIAVAPPPVSSHFAPNAGGGRSAFDGVFVGRFTIQAGQSLSGGMFFSVLTEPGNSDGQDLVLGGAGVAFETSPAVFQVLALRGYRVCTVDIDNPSDATSAGLNDGEAFGSADVWDLWVQVVPAPGSVAIMGLAGVAAIRRRRA